MKKEVRRNVHHRGHGAPLYDINEKGNGLNQRAVEDFGRKKKEEPGRNKPK